MYDRRENSFPCPQVCTAVFTWQKEEEKSGGCNGADERRTQVGEHYDVLKCIMGLWGTVLLKILLQTLLFIVQVHEIVDML